jgi:hypothetical protein
MTQVTADAFASIGHNDSRHELRAYVVHYVRQILDDEGTTTPEKLDWVYQLFDAADQVASRRGWQL